jgi:hypothetical protein
MNCRKRYMAERTHCVKSFGLPVEYVRTVEVRLTAQHRGLVRVQSMQLDWDLIFLGSIGMSLAKPAGLQPSKVK